MPGPSDPALNELANMREISETEHARSISYLRYGLHLIGAQIIYTKIKRCWPHLPQ